MSLLFSLSLFHSQLQAGNNPVPEPVLQSSESVSLSQENKISAMLKNFISKLVNHSLYVNKGTS